MYCPIAIKEFVTRETAFTIHKKRLDKPKKPCNGGDALKSSFSCYSGQRLFSCIFSAALFFFIFFRLISPYVSMAYSENMKKVEKTVANQSKVSYIF